MLKNIPLEQFMLDNRISQEIWDKSECNWGNLCEIAIDFESNNEVLNRSGEFFARVIQTFPGVHSVRWRVKKTSHLLEKIVRKCAQKEKKYENINLDNYSTIVTDLIGIRALHLFKDEYLAIDSFIRKNWETVEIPIIYFREGDDRPSVEFSKKNRFKVKQHPAGYRSVHYVLESSPLKQKVIAEIQVRTIFEEGWSEIDHKIRYPNFSKDESVKSFLAIFNRLAGSADEMGTFVKGLVSSIKEYTDESAIIQVELDMAQKNRDDAYQKMEKIAGELTNAQDISQSDKQKIVDLQREIERFKSLARSGGAMGGMRVKGSSGTDLIGQIATFQGAANKFLDLSKGIKSQGSFEQRLESEKKRSENRLDSALSPNEILKSKNRGSLAEKDKLLSILKNKES